MNANPNEREKPLALSLLSSERPRNVGWKQAAAFLFGDWGTSRLYVLGLAFLVAGRSSFWLISAMSVLIIAVGWAYTQICRIYPDGGGVYTAARQRSTLLGVIGALLLFADYTVTASLSAVEAFHYFGLGGTHTSQVAEADPGDDIRLETHAPDTSHAKSSIWHLNSPALWAIISIIAIGALNLFGPKHTAGPALFAAIGMIAITLLITVFALPQINWSNLHLGRAVHSPLKLWEAFVAIVLALSGVEAIASLTGVMKKPVYKTASKSIWVVALEVAIFNILLALIMVATDDLGRDGHKEDMLAFLAKRYIGAWGEWPVRIIGGLLLLSATNTAVGALMSTMYVMSRDSELPRMLQKLNSFGAPWIAGIIAATAPAIVLLMINDLQSLAQLYAIGIVGAVAINCLLTALHPRLRTPYRKLPMAVLGMLLVAIWVTLAATKIHALIFVSIVLAIGLIARKVTRYAAERSPKPSLLRQAIIDQLSPEAFARPKLMLTTAGSDQLAEAALAVAKESNASLLVCFVREVALSYRVNVESRLTLDTDPAAQALFIDFLSHGHRYGVPIIPVYDTGTNAVELIAEQAAINGVSEVLLGSSRRGAIHTLIKGSFQRKLEAVLPEGISVKVISPAPAGDPEPAESARA